MHNSQDHIYQGIGISSLPNASNTMGVTISSRLQDAIRMLGINKQSVKMGSSDIYDTSRSVLTGERINGGNLKMKSGAYDLAQSYANSFGSVRNQESNKKSKDRYISRVNGLQKTLQEFSSHSFGRTLKERS